MRSIYLQSFLLISLVVLLLCPGQISNCKNEQRAITPKLGNVELWFCCTALLLNEISSIYLQSFLLIPLVVLLLCPGQSSKCKNEQRAITPKLGKVELWFFCTALLLNEIYQPTKFLVYTSCCFRVMSWTKFKVYNK
jgi:hypothetical protein